MTKKLIGISLAAAMAISFTGCGDKDSTAESTDAKVTTQANAPGDDGGFNELPIFEDEEVGGLLNVSAVYFQPVPMSGGNEDISKFNLHLECDVSALEGNTLGYGAGDWVPYLTVDYDVVGSDGNSAAAGTFMVMAASDGPHYGANINLDKADTYTVKFTFHSPGDNGYLIHLDDVTGPGGTLDDYFGNGPLTVEVGGWDYTPVEW